MSWSQFIASVISSLAWPTAIVIIVVLFRKSIVKLIPDLKQLKYGAFELEFNQGLKELTAQAKQALPPITQTDTRDDRLSQSGQALRELAAISPRVCIVETWRILESEIRSKLTTLGIALRHKGSISEMLNTLESETSVELQTSRLLLRMVHLRNQAAHAENIGISEAEANEYVDVAVGALGAIGSMERASQK